MSISIPAHIEPRRLVDRGIVLNGAVPTAKMSRLNALLDAPAGDVQVDLAFRRDEGGVSAMHGRYQVDVAMVCQRCLNQVVLTLDAQCDVGFVRNDEAAKNLPRDYEPVIVDEEGLDLHALIEDELLLALPVVPMHSLETCQHPPGFEPDPAEPEEEAEKPNPFSVLAKLKRDT